jgi:glycosidase
MKKLSRDKNASWKDEIFYQIFVRSFYDSNGDGIGDLKGIAEKLDYLQDLGVTAIWLNPIFPAQQYHNYFPHDFFDVDPAYGSIHDFVHLCGALHSRGMKILIDIEPQYISKDHPWYKGSHRHPESNCASRLFYEDPRNEKAAHLEMTMAFEDFRAEIGLEEYLLVNLRSRDVLKSHRDIFSWWLDPIGSGEGVDGFRLDHVMDDLDGKGLATGLLRGYWRRIRTHVQRIKPDAFFLAEQADWGDGLEILRKSGMDAAFSFPLISAASSFDKRILSEACRRVCLNFPEEKHACIVIENHDIPRYASRCGNVTGKTRIGALLTVMLRGIPCLYYGQELGMQGSLADFPSDMHLPLREAFPWHARHDGRGTALWYKDSDYWPASSAALNSITALEEQMQDAGSLWHLYRRLISLRKSRISVRRGSYKEVHADSDKVFAFCRSYRNETTLMVLNLGNPPVSTVISFPGSSASKAGTLLSASAEAKACLHNSALELYLESYGYAILDIALI